MVRLDILVGGGRGAVGECRVEGRRTRRLDSDIGLVQWRGGRGALGMKYFDLEGSLIVDGRFAVPAILARCGLVGLMTWEAEIDQNYDAIPGMSWSWWTLTTLCHPGLAQSLSPGGTVLGPSLKQRTLSG